MKVSVKFDVTDAVIQNEAVSSGEPGNKTRIFETTLADLSLVAREAVIALRKGDILENSGKPMERITVTLQKFSVRPARWESDPPEIEGDPVQLWHGSPCREEIEGELSESAYDLRMAQEALEPHLAVHKTAMLAKAAERKRLEEEKAALAAAKAAQDAEDKARREGDKKAWIEANGSDHLQRAFNSGYDCQRKYVKERAALEVPGFAVDFDDMANWKERSCPSLKGLDLIDALMDAISPEDVELGPPAVVWLTESLEKPDPEDYYGEPFEPCEAVIIRGYLGKYDLVRIV